MNVNDSAAGHWVIRLTDVLIASMQNWSTLVLSRLCFSNRVVEHPREFELLFFRMLLAKTTARYFQHTMINPLPEYQPVCAINYPDFSQERWAGSKFVEFGFAQMFTDMIRQESDAQGAPFDVTFACEIVAEVIDHPPDKRTGPDTLKYLEGVKGQTWEKSFHQMLEDGDNIWG